METLLLWPLIGAVCTQLGANAETRETREQIRSFIVTVNPAFQYPDDAANLLVKIEAEGGPPATLFAALIKLESRWGAILKRHPWNLTQITQYNQRKLHGRLLQGWAESVRWGAQYFTWNLAGAAKPGRDVEYVYFVALARYNDGPLGPRTPKGRRYARVVLRFYDEAFGI